MALVGNTSGKGRVRVLRLDRRTERHVARELTVQAMMTGDFAAVFTHADNGRAVSTDTVRNLVNAVARETLTLGTEGFCTAVARRALERYPQVTGMSVTAHETRWVRHVRDGVEHPHAFTLDGNGRPFARVTMTREAMHTTSGIEGFTVLKTTGSGWADYAHDSYTTLPETRDRLCATSLDAEWPWRAEPADHDVANALILATMLDVFASTYSASVQDSLYRMGMAALEAVPEIGTVSLRAPNKHYIPVNLAPFGLDNEGVVFLPTDEPHGQIECVVGRD